MINIGKIVTTHGLSGEVKVKSEFEYLDKAFREGNEISIDNKKYIIKKYKVMPKYQVIKLEGITNIDMAKEYIGKDIFIKKHELKLSKGEYLYSELLNYKVMTKEGQSGNILEIFDASKTNKIMRCKIDDKEVLIPFNSPEIESINTEEEIVYLDLISR